MNSHSVEILLSTYNGEKYLKEQLSSLSSQSMDNIRITVRDDGSTDGTLEILHNFCRDNESLTYFSDRNVGVVASFLALLEISSDQSEFVAFCDQDDVWHRHKLEVAVNRLTDGNSRCPKMYCSRTKLVDEELNFIGYGRGVKRPASFENAMLQNIATGCTIVLNRSAVDLLKKRLPNAAKIRMHDWWVYLVISAFGSVIFDNNSYIYYRQHANNVVGVNVGFTFWLNRILRVFKRNKRQIVDHVTEFYRLYGEDLPGPKRTVCLRFIEYAGSENVVKRILYSLNAPVYRQSMLDNFLFRMLIIIGYR